MSSPPSCLNSLLAYFPEEIYRHVGSSVVLPQLLESLDDEKLAAVQFLRGGLVRLTFMDSESCKELLQRGLTFGDTRIRLSRADAKIRSIHLRDLPTEVPGAEVIKFFSSFGEVISVTRSTFDGFPHLYNGNRVVKIALDREVPYFVRICEFPCRAWYAGQPLQCSVCRKSDHRASDCPLSGLCRRCRQPGHMARECRQAWGSFRPSSEVLAVPDSDSPEYVPQSQDEDGDMVSVDEEVVAQTPPPVPAPVPVSAPPVSMPPVSSPVSTSSVPVSSVTVSSAPAPAPPPSVFTSVSTGVQSVSSVSAPRISASESPISSDPPVGLSPSEAKLVKIVESRLTSSMASFSRDSLLQMSEKV